MTMDARKQRILEAIVAIYSTGIPPDLHDLKMGDAQILGLRGGSHCGTAGIIGQCAGGALRHWCFPPGAGWRRWCSPPKRWFAPDCPNLIAK